MRFSVIVPIYNTAGTIVRCVESIIASGLPEGDYEIILVNDGSTDDSGRVCDSLARNYPFIRVTAQDNKGVSVARNTGVAMSTGEYVCFCDSDDYFASGGLRNVIRHCGEGIDMVRYYCDFVFQDDRKPKTPVDRKEGKVTFQGTGKEYLRRFGIETFCWNYLYRREFLLSNGLFFTPGIIAEDTDFMFRVMMADPMIISLDAHVYQYSIRPNSISTDKSQGQSRRFATDLSGTLVRIESILKDYKNSDPLLYYSCRKSIETRLITLFSRTLSSDYSKEEFKALIQSLEAVGLLPLETDPSSKQERISRTAISILSCFPGSFPPAKWMFRHFFLPIVYPRLRMIRSKHSC